MSFEAYLQILPWTGHQINLPQEALGLKSLDVASEGELIHLPWQ